jgi:hypothetical protein
LTRSAEAAIAEHLDTIFVDFTRWLEQLTEQRATERDGLVRELAVLHGALADLNQDETLVGADYARQFRAGKPAAGDVAAAELERIAAERADLELAVADVEARLEEWYTSPTPTRRSTGGTSSARRSAARYQRRVRARRQHRPARRASPRST